MEEPSTLLLFVLMQELRKILPLKNYQSIKEYSKPLLFCYGCYEHHHCEKVKIEVWDFLEPDGYRGDWEPRMMNLCKKCLFAIDELNMYDFNYPGHIKEVVETFYDDLKKKKNEASESVESLLDSSLNL